MHKLIVSLPTNREFEGRLTLEEENGLVLAGPFPVCGLADRAAAGRHGNPSGHSQLPFGDTPLGRYRVAGIHATGPKTSLPAEQFGPHGVIVLTPAAGDAALADANGRFCIVIQGGTLGPGRRLRPTNGALRLTDRDQRKLVRALRRSLHPCVCECVAAIQPATERTVARTAPYESVDPPLLVAAVSLPSAAVGTVSFAGNRFSFGGVRARRFAAPSFRLAGDTGGGGGTGGTGGGYDSGSEFSSVDSAYINQNEGFVPSVYADTAGLPTIGYGINLSAQSVESLQDAGVPQSIIDQVTPLLGMTAGEYATWSEDNSLTLSDADAQTLSTDVQNQYFDATGQAFNSTTSLGISFSDLPTAAQTAICDLWYNMGNLSSAAPNFWDQVTSGQWQDAINNLQNNFSSSAALNQRASDAGDLLQTALDAGTLPKPKN